MPPRTPRIRPSILRLLSAAIVLGFIYAVIWPLAMPDEPTLSEQCLLQVRELGRRLSLYHAQYGALPAELPGGPGTDRRDLFCPSKRYGARPRPPAKGWGDYVYVGDTVVAGNTPAPILWDQPGNHRDGTVTVLFSDFHAKLMSTEAFAKLRAREGD